MPDITEKEIRNLRQKQQAPIQRHPNWSITYEWTTKEIDCLLKVIDELREGNKKMSDTDNWARHNCYY